MILVQREGEVELVVAADLEVRVEVGAGLLDADGVDLLEHAEPLEDRQIVRQQRFADVEAGVMLFLQQRDAPALLGEQGRDGRAGRSTAYDKDIALVHGPPSHGLIQYHTACGPFWRIVRGDDGIPPGVAPAS